MTRPRITAGDVVAALCYQGVEAPTIHGEPVALVEVGNRVEVRRAGRLVWSGRLVAYPAAWRVDAGEGLRQYPCPGCGAPVAARLASEAPRADCPECGLPLALSVVGRPLERGGWKDESHWYRDPSRPDPAEDPPAPPRLGPSRLTVTIQARPA